MLYKNYFEFTKKIVIPSQQQLLGGIGYYMLATLNIQINQSITNDNFKVLIINCND